MKGSLSTTSYSRSLFVKINDRCLKTIKLRETIYTRLNFIHYWLTYSELYIHACTISHSIQPVTIPKLFSKKKQSVYI